MTMFLFWNINRKNSQDAIKCLARLHNVDVLMLAECTIAPERLLITLNQGYESKYHYLPGLCTKIKVFSRYGSRFISPTQEEDRLTIRRLMLPNKPDILLAITHFPSKLYMSNESQASLCSELANSIDLAERKVGHSRTILVGDLNMNPFESGMVSANKLHGVMSKQIALKQKRTVQGREYGFFYNPMWSLLGDASSGPPGTFYYNNSEPITFFWNMFDQVLLRPSLLPYFDNEELKIVTSCGDTELLSPQGIPNGQISDHLPILFKLNI